MFFMKYIHLKANWIIKAPRSEVYRIITDFENAPKYFPKVAKSIKKISQDGDRLVMEAQTKSFGRTFSVRMNTQLCPPWGFISENVSSLGIEHERFEMQEVPEGTRIIYTNAVEIKSPFFRIFAKLLIGWYAMKFWEKAVIANIRQMLEK